MWITRPSTSSSHPGVTRPTKVGADRTTSLGPTDGRTPSKNPSRLPDLPPRDTSRWYGRPCRRQKATTWASGEPCALKGARTVWRGEWGNTARLCALPLPYDLGARNELHRDCVRKPRSSGGSWHPYGSHAALGSHGDPVRLWSWEHSHDE